MLESDLSNDIKKLNTVKPQLEILLVGTEEKKLRETLGYHSKNDEAIGQLKINNPLRRWTQEDIRVFARFLLLPFT